MRLSESDSYRAFGRAYGLGDLEAAKEALERCLADPSLADTPERSSLFLRELAQVALEAGNAPSARERLLEAESCDPDSSLNNYYLSGIYLSGLGEPQEALPRAERALEALEAEGLDAASKSHWDSLIRTLRGRCLAALGRMDEAASELDLLREGELVADHTVELCEAMMSSAPHRELAVKSLKKLAADLRSTGEPERIALADQIDEKVPD